MIALPFILNSLFNFAIGLLVAKFLGPSEYGRYALALSIAVVLQTLGLDWLRLSATRFYSEHDRRHRPQIRATLDVIFAAIACVALLAAIGIAVSGLNLPLSPALVSLAIGTAVASGLFEFATALIRARFLDRSYAKLVVVRTLLSIVLTVGGAWYFGSAKVALIGVILSVVGSLVFSHRALNDETADPRLADRTLARRYAVYALPIVLANVLYQMVPMLNRGLVAHIHDFAEAGQLALAFDIGIRIVGAIGAALDVLLFQLAVLAEKTFGADAARQQIARNMGLVFAVILPVVTGCWLILPSFGRLFVPEPFRESFGHYFTLMLPAMLCIALTNFSVGPAFQIAHRTLPLIIGGLTALIANALAILLLPPSQGATRFALAQSIASGTSLAVMIGFLFTLTPAWPRWRDIGGTIVVTALMLMAVIPLRMMTPGVVTLLLEMSVGVTIYTCGALLFDVGALRTMLLRKLSAWPALGSAIKAIAKSKGNIG